jgi:hypothetical protein
MTFNAPKSGALGTQEMLRFDEPLTVVLNQYDLDDALVAAKNRNSRVGELAKTDYGDGFRERTGGLWVPHSGTENTAVTSLPEVMISRTRRLVHDKVWEKYAEPLEEGEVSERQVTRWARFAGGNASKALRSKFEALIYDSQERYRRIYEPLLPERPAQLDPHEPLLGVIERDRVEASGVAMRGIGHYLIMLRAFHGDKEKLEAGGRRRWPREAHRHKYAEQQEWARNFMSRMPDVDFDRLVKEAYYSERSRHEYMKLIKSHHADMVRIQGEKNLLRERVPIEVYDLDPRAKPYNYIDDEFVG